MTIKNLTIVTLAALSACGRPTKIQREEVLAAVVTTPSVAPVQCEVFEGLTALPTTNQVRGTYRIGLNSASFAEIASDLIPFHSFKGTAAETVTKNFAMRCALSFEVINAGTHTFRLNSDDGSELYVNGVRIVNNGGSHGMQIRTGSVSLPAGVHSLIVTYFQGNGPKGLILSVQKPSIAVPEQGL